MRKGLGFAEWNASCRNLKKSVRMKIRVLALRVFEPRPPFLRDHSLAVVFADNDQGGV